MTRPPRARFHCKHYEYETGTLKKAGGPKCGLGIELGKGKSVKKCMPDPKENCEKRQDWSDEERKAWDDFVAKRITDLSNALDAIEPVHVGFMRQIQCPACEGRGKFSVQRVQKSAYANCTNPECIGPAHFNVGHLDPWPVKGD